MRIMEKVGMVMHKTAVVFLECVIIIIFLVSGSSAETLCSPYKEVEYKVCKIASDLFSNHIEPLKNNNMPEYREISSIDHYAVEIKSNATAYVVHIGLSYEYYNKGGRIIGGGATYVLNKNDYKVIEVIYGE